MKSIVNKKRNVFQTGLKNKYEQHELGSIKGIFRKIERVLINLKREREMFTKRLKKTTTFP